MNTGKIIETKHLFLKPGNNATDSEPFIKMLRQDGDFEAEVSEESISSCKGKRTYDDDVSS